MPVIDPSGFHISAQLVTSRGVFPLRVGGAQQGGQSFFTGESGQDMLDLPVVERANIELNFGMGGNISVDVYAPFEISKAILNSELFRIGNLLQVQIGYPASGAFLPWFSGMTTKPSFRIDPSQGLTATITAVNGAFTAVRNSNPAVWEGSSYADIVTDIASRPYNNWRVELPEQTRTGSVPNRNDPLYRERGSISQSNRADWPFLYHLCRTASCELVLLYTNDQESRPTLQVRRRSDMLSGEPVYTFVMWGQVDFINRFPLFNFETSGEGVWMPRGNAPVRYGDWNPDTQEEIAGVVTQEDRTLARIDRLLEETLGSGVTDEALGTEITLSALADVGIFLPARGAESGYDAAEGAAQEADEDSGRGGINASFSSIGLPFVYPGDLVRILGVGDFFDGNYLVEGITHEASAGEWTMNFKCLTNAPGGRGAIAQRLVQTWSNPNRQEAPEHDEPSSGVATDRVPEGTE